MTLLQVYNTSELKYKYGDGNIMNTLNINTQKMTFPMLKNINLGLLLTYDFIDIQMTMFYFDFLLLLQHIWELKHQPIFVEGTITGKGILGYMVHDATT